LGSSGALLRLTLSYDFTFYCLLALSLKDKFCGFVSCRCPVKLFGKRSCVKLCDELEYAADLAVMLLYAKLCDNLYDRDGALVSKLALLYVKPRYQKIANRRKDEDEKIRNYIENQQTIEKNGGGLDLAAHGTADILSFFFSQLSQKDEQKDALSRLGYVLGRWIYILDAADDLESDIKKKRFNPLNKNKGYTKQEIEQIKKECENDLNVCISEAQDALLKLELRHFKSLLENIIFLGLKNSQSICLKYQNQRERKKAYSGKSV